MLALGIAATRADTVSLRNGTVINGTYMGGSPQQVQIAVGDQVRSLDIKDIAEIQFTRAAMPQERDRRLPESSAEVTLPAGTNLVISQITTACVACHDAPTDIAHMQSNGGHFYDTRSNTLAAAGEQCLMCHGPGRIAAIGEVHLQ